ncbi:helix-turn-helix transcriptional regulator [Streptomyces sp. 8P21H-1]|uniref:ArsR/SmtB family transcription factor n=1 Tax=Streptomyces sp. 8P21H-1 TaxID=2737048 RepID=UPI00156EE2B5|nr:helix-turn-helix domain-containing protein [Streptomyces sp. 8P21H-1]NSL43177.1 helix-turn-helix transcriptional regulator [Streptomyces sp. 8P21H-1]
MLRIHFTDADLARTRCAGSPNALWEITASLHRFQTRKGRWAYAEWHRATRVRLEEKGLGRVLREILLPVFPRASYFPDFLTPPESREGLDAGLEAVLATPPRQVLAEVAQLDRLVGAPAWAPRLAERETREELVRAIRAYHDAAIAPYEEQMQARLEAERAMRCRALLDGGVEGMLTGLGPTMHRRRSVLHVDFPSSDRDLHLNGRGLTLVPSYFCWHTPTTLADPRLPPVLVYPLHHEAPAPRPDSPGPPGRWGERLSDSSAGPAGSPASLTGLLGRARAGVLCAAAVGATNAEIARAVGISAPSASRYATALRSAGLITSNRCGATVLHTLTPTGAAVLRAGRRAAESGRGRPPGREG